MAYTKVTGNLVDIGDLDLTNVGQIQLDSIAGDADSNTSITFSGSDVITIATGGSGRLTIGDGALSPVTDNQIDLGTSSLEYKDLFLDGTAHVDTLDVDANATVAGTLGVTGATTLTGDLVVGANDNEEALLTVRYSTVPAYISSTYDGTSGISAFSTNQYNNDDGSASLSSAANTAYANAAIKLYSGTGDSSIRFYTATAANTTPTEYMRVDHDGTVGIGTTSPNTKLHAATGSNGSGLVDVARFQNTGTTANDGARIQLTAGTSTSGAGIGCLGDALNSAHLVFHAGGNTERMRIASDGKVGIGTDEPGGQVHINDNWASATNGTLIHVKNESSQYTAGDPYLTNSVPHGILITEDDSNTNGPTKQGLVLYNDNNTAGAFSPMLSFAKRETGSSPYRATMAAIYAKAPTGTGNSDAWIDGQLHFATAGAASEGTKSRMFIDKEGKVVVGPGNTTPDSLLHVEDSTHTAITIQAGTNSSASLRLKNDAQDWDLNTQTNDNFAIYNQTNSTQPFTVSPAGIVTTSLNPAFRANAKTDETYSNGWQKVLYDVSVTQRGSAFASSRFTAPVDGWYQFNAQFTADNNSDNDGTLSLFINGSTTDLAGSSSMSNTGANYDSHVVSGCCYLAATHYVEVYRYSSVSTETRTSTAYGGWFSGFMIG